MKPLSTEPARTQPNPSRDDQSSWAVLLADAWDALVVAKARRMADAELEPLRAEQDDLRRVVALRNEQVEKLMEVNLDLKIEVSTLREERKRLGTMADERGPAATKGVGRDLVIAVAFIVGGGAVGGIMATVGAATIAALRAILGGA